MMLGNLLTIQSANDTDTYVHVLSKYLEYFNIPVY